MKVFWYSSPQIDDLATYARLSLAFDSIVVPDASATKYFPHSDLRVLNPVQRNFAPIEARNDLAEFLAGSGPIAMIGNLNETWAEGWKNVLGFRYERFVNFVKVSAQNEGVLIGTQLIPDAELNACLRDPELVGYEPQKARVAQALLSLAGVSIALPNIRPSDIDVLLQAKVKYAEELADYQAYLAELLGGVWDVVKTDPSYDDLDKWMRYIADTKIAPALRRVESALRAGDKTLCERLGYSLITEVPTLVSGQLKADHLPMLSAALSALLSVFAPNLAQSIRERRTLQSAFGLSYLYRLRKLTT